MPQINSTGVEIHYEVHGEGDWLLCMGGWGTFCRDRLRDVPRYLREHYKVLVFDYEGLGESGMRPGALSTAQIAQDAFALCDEISADRVHVVGMVGMGACVGQEMAIAQPSRVRSLAMTGCWAKVDRAFEDQLISLRDVHAAMGFPAFQLLCASLSFRPDFYEVNRDRLIGKNGAWQDLDGHFEAHARLVDACLNHDTLQRLPLIEAPTLVVHAGADILTSPRLTMPLEAGIPGARAVVWPEAAHVIAGKEQKMKFDTILSDFLEDVAS